MIKPSLKRSGSTTDLSTPSAKLPRTGNNKNNTTSAFKSRAASSLSSLSFEQQRRRLEASLTASEIALAEAHSRLRLAELKCDEKESRIARLERDRENLAEREAERKADAQDLAEESWAAEKRVLEQKVSTLGQNLSESQESYSTLEESYRSLEHRASQTEARLASNISNETALQSRLDATTHSLTEARTTITALENKITSLESSLTSSQNVPDLTSTESVIRSELTRQVSHLKSLEARNARLLRENSVLKARDVDIDLLKEDKKTLEAKLKPVQQMRMDLVNAEMEVQSLLREKEEWALFLAEGNDSEATVTDPKSLSKALAKERIENTILKDRVGEIKMQLSKRDGLIEDLEERIDELESKVHQVKEEKLKALQSEKRAQSSGMLLEKERDFLKIQLDTYSIEEAQLMDPAAYDSQKTNRISQLEELLSLHQKQLSDINKEADRLRGLLEVAGGNTTLLNKPQSDGAEDDTKTSQKMNQSVKELLQRNDILRDELDTLQSEHELLTKECESLSSQVARLQDEVGSGAYNPTTTRVLQLAENPASMDLAIRTETLDNLKKENTTLLEQVDRLKKAISEIPAPVPEQLVKEAAKEEKPEEATVPRATYDNQVAEVARMQAETEAAEKKRQRLNEAFRVKAQELRETVSTLFGWRLDLRENGRARLTSIFAPSSSHHLNFQAGLVTNADGEERPNSKSYTLVGDGEGMSDSEKRAFEFWAVDRQSIPGFLATILLENYDSVTRGGKKFVVQG